MKSKQPFRTYFVRLPHLANLELLHASNITHKYPPHIHEHLCVVLMRHGTESTTIRGTTHTSVAGSIFILNPEELHSSISVDAEYQVFKIPPFEFRRIASDVQATPYFSDFEIHDPLLFRSLLDLYSKLEESNSPLQQESEFVATIGMLIDRYAEKSFSGSGRDWNENHKVDFVREYLKAGYNENISLSHLTTLTDLDRFSLLRAFSNRVGVPPHEFQTQIRIAHARELIRNGCSISDAALRTGFFDQSHLSRHFKRIVGMTPGEYLSGCNFVQELHC